MARLICRLFLFKVISALADEFKTGYSNCKIIRMRILEHKKFDMLGKLLILVTKMDHPLVDWEFDGYFHHLLH